MQQWWREPGHAFLTVIPLITLRHLQGAMFGLERAEKSWGKGRTYLGRKICLACKDLTWFYFLHSELSAKSKALQLQVVEDGKLDSKYWGWVILHDQCVSFECWHKAPFISGWPQKLRAISNHGWKENTLTGVSHGLDSFTENLWVSF